MKKLIPICLTFFLVACSSTTPALRDVIAKNLNHTSLESEVKVKLETDFPKQNLDKEQQVLLDVLKDGIVMDIKQQDKKNTYFKLQFKNPSTLEKYGYWRNGAEPYFEAYNVNNDAYFKSSSENQFIKVSNNSTIVNANLQSLNSEDKEELEKFVTSALSDYIKQYDYKLRSISVVDDKVITPIGDEDVKKIHVEMKIDDIIGLASYTLDNLSKYSNLNSLINDLTLELNKINSEETSSSSLEEVQQYKQSFESYLLMIKGALSQISEEEIEKKNSVDITFNLNYDFYVNNEGYIVKNVTALNVSLENKNSNAKMNHLGQEIPQKVGMKLTVESLNWNINQKVEYVVPDFSHALNFEDLVKDKKNLNQLENDSFVKEQIRKQYYPKTGNLTLNSQYAWVGKNHKKLDASPYIVKGYTLVPLRTIAEIADTTPQWNEKDRTVLFNAEGIVVKVQIGSKVAWINGKQVLMPVAPEIKKGRTFVPLRFISENLGAKVEYHNETKMIDINFEK